MAHFFHPYTGTPVSSVEVFSDGQVQIALWGGGPGPDYSPLNVTLVPPMPGAIYPPDGHDLGDHTRIFWISGKCGDQQLHALSGELDYAQPLNLVRLQSTYRSVPFGVRQNHARSECWAAALSAWLQVTPGRPKLTKQQLVDKYADMEDDGLSEQQLTGAIVKDFSMGWWATKSVTYEDLLASKLLSRLRGHGHLYFIYKSGQQSSHALCVYGVGCPDHKEPMISSMDPWYGHAYNRPFYEFYRRPLFIGWPFA